MNERDISAIIVDAAIEVHRVLGGAGLLESIYEEALSHELELRGMNVQRQVHVPIRYKSKLLKTTMRLDMVVERLVVVECKAVEQYNKLSQAQALTYLRQIDLKLALVINFGEELVGRGVHRVVNKLP